MDYPKSLAVPLRLVGDKFADRAGAVPGSVIPAAAWANPLTDEVLAAQAAAGLTAIEGQNNQLPDAINILARGGALGFRVKPQNPATLSVDIEAGTFFNGVTGLMVSAPAAIVGPIAAPTVNPRNDIVYIDAETGLPGIQTGTEAPVPADPSLATNKLPVTRIRAVVGMTEIAAADIDERRYLGALGGAAKRIVSTYTFLENSTVAFGTAATPYSVSQQIKIPDDGIILTHLTGRVDCPGVANTWFPGLRVNGVDFQSINDKGIPSLPVGFSLSAGGFSLYHGSLDGGPTHSMMLDIAQSGMATGIQNVQPNAQSVGTGSINIAGATETFRVRLQVIDFS